MSKKVEINMNDLFSSASFGGGGGGGGGGGNSARRSQMARNATQRWRDRGSPTLATQLDFNGNGTAWDEVGTGLAMGAGVASGNVAGYVSAGAAYATYLSTMR